MSTRARLVRRAPLLERIKASLNPLDFLLWLSEEINSNDWEDFQRQWAYPTGLTLNVIFMVARANSGAGSDGSDVFADAYETGSGWFAWLASSVVWLLTVISFSNAVYTFWRSRQYRLFEANIDVAPSTPSAHRARVDSSPFVSTPLRMLQDTLLSSSAQGRAHPDATRDVWEVNVWDPTPLCLRIFCLFSPAHVLIYDLFLPLNPLDSRPSVTVATTAFMAFLLSLQLAMMQSSFQQQARDTALIHKEVQHEYDTKFVQPIIYHPVRDAGTQVISEDVPARTYEVLVSPPKTYVNRGFKPKPNTNYAKHYDPDGFSTPQQHYSRSTSTPILHTPPQGSAADYSTPSKAGGTPGQLPSAMRRTTGGDGGHMGVYSHGSSPLKKHVAIQSTPQNGTPASASGSRLLGRSVSPQKRANGSALAGDRVSRLRGDGDRRDSSRF